ncbi:MAG: hypothetical protein E7596_00705 [Ruminococcaceae bacterium]|nr:hypothetical protein [Oscillospiraceae bacterium]
MSFREELKSYVPLSTAELNQKIRELRGAFLDVALVEIADSVKKRIKADILNGKVTQTEEKHLVDGYFVLKDIEAKIKDLDVPGFNAEEIEKLYIQASDPQYNAIPFFKSGLDSVIVSARPVEERMKRGLAFLSLKRTFTYSCFLTEGTCEYYEKLKKLLEQDEIIVSSVVAEYKLVGKEKRVRLEFNSFDESPTLKVRSDYDVPFTLESVLLKYQIEI